MAVVRESMSEVLSKIKMYKTRIDSKISYIGDSSFENSIRMINIKKKNEKECNHVPVDTAKENIVAMHQSNLALIDNLRKLNMLKNGVNDMISVTVAGKEMTIAQVLSMSNGSIKRYQEQYIDKLKSDYRDAINTINRCNEKVFTQDKINAWISVYLGTTVNGLQEMQKDDPDRVQEAIDKYHEQNDIEIIDPIDILSEIDRLEKYYDALYNNIGFTLSAMNARIIVEYDLDSDDPNFWRIVNMDEILSIKKMIDNEEDSE